MNEVTMKKLSDAVSDPVIKAYRLGGFGLAFLILGSLLMLAAFLTEQRTSLTYGLFAVGMLLVACTCLLFYLEQIKPLLRVQQRIETNRDLIDTAQRAAIEMADLSAALQALAFTHASLVANFLQEIRPQIRLLPIVGALADQPVVEKAEDLSVSVVKSTVKVREVVTDIKYALETSNPEKLEVYVDDIKELRRRIEELLPKVGAA